MTQTAGLGGWQLAEAADHDLEELMSWFRDADEVNIWAGPRFRFPFTRSTFRKDFSAFGQMYERYGRINLARLVVNPGMRGRGIGKRLVASLIEIAPSIFSSNEFSLFSYRHNAAALGCYQSMGFVIQDYPEDAPMADECYYLVRPR